MNFKYILYFFIISFAINQNANIINPLNTFSNDINKFNLNQSFSLSVSSLNGFSNTNSIFTNNLNYKLSDKLSIYSNIHLISPMNSNFQKTNNFDIKYDLLLDYKISDSFQLKLKMTNLNFYKMNYNQLVNE